MRSKPFLLATFGASLSLAMTLHAPSGWAEDLPPDSWLMPFDVNQRYRLTPATSTTVDQRDIYEFMWQSFVAINWPARLNGSRGEPDREATLAPWNTGEPSQGPVVWETHRRPGSVFVKPKEWPLSWNDPPGETPCPHEGAKTNYAAVVSNTTYSEHPGGLNQPFIHVNYPTGPVADQNGNYLRYEVGMGQSYFSYIKQFRYYNPRRQIRAVRNFTRFVEKHGTAPKPSDGPKYFQPLPNGNETYLVDDFDLPEYALHGMVEWKAAWKQLDGDDDPHRFFWREMRFQNPDGTCTDLVRAGLIALHIHRVTPFGHIAATFEQVDNTGLQSAYSSPTVPDAAPLPPHPSLNPSKSTDPAPPNYPNGYEVCDWQGNDCQSGRRGLIPPPIQDGSSLPEHPAITNVARAVAIPPAVQEKNDSWRGQLEGTVWFYYQMIGSQNKDVSSELDPNLDLGPGVLGAQVSATNNLINTALESYTQKGWSCALCHQNAFPQGVKVPFARHEQNYKALHVMSFLLQRAITNRGR